MLQMEIENVIIGDKIIRLSHGEIDGEAAGKV